MIHSPACTAIVKQFEGCHLTAYPDPASGGDPWTIGWGATGCDVKQGAVWTQAQADARLEFDLSRFDAEVSKLIDAASTTQGQFDALVDFSYNLGAANLAKSTLLRKHLAGDYEGAAEQFPLWVHASGKVMPGLIRRRSAEMALYRGQA